MEARATVIIPTFGQAGFARWALKSVQRQTVKDIEICLICDGSPEGMVSYFRALAKDDRRVRLFSFPKSPRTGEPYRDIVIKQTTGRIICYCSHDDLWFPTHVEEVEKTLSEHFFTNSFHVFIDPPGGSRTVGGFICADIKGPEARGKILSGNGFFGLTFGAHTRESYFGLREGWETTPRGVATDLYMWRKFLSAYPSRSATTMKITALGFPQAGRSGWPDRARDTELKKYFGKIQSPTFLREFAGACAAAKPGGDSPSDRVFIFKMRDRSSLSLKILDSFPVFLQTKQLH